MKVRIRLYNQGLRNHRFWWIVVQPMNMNPRGRYLEKVGYWIPRQTKTVQRAMIINKHRIRYWLGAGATCTDRVHKILEKFDFVPKLPVPFGSNSLYEKPEKEYDMQYFKKTGPKGNNQELYVKQQLQEYMTIIERKKRLQQEAMANFGENVDAAIPKLEEIKTTDIESEEVDVFERKKKFEELSKRLEKHRKETAHLRGNDLRYNIYMKKLQKLTRMDLGLDVEAYKDYINNLKQFAHLNADFEIYARDQLAVNDPKHRELIQFNIEGKDSSQLDEVYRLQLNLEDIQNVLRKLKRNASAFLNKKDESTLQEFVTHTRDYLDDYEIYVQSRLIYEKRRRELKTREDSSQYLNTEQVTEKQLIKADVSKREFDQIKLILSVDRDIFKPADMNSLSPHLDIVDVSKYENLTKDAKEILYRPPKLRKLFEKYWQLQKVCMDKSLKPNENDNPEKHVPKYPPKKENEIQWIDRIYTTIQGLINDDMQEYLDDMKKQQEKLDQVTNPATQTLYYTSSAHEKFKEYKKLSDEEKAALPKKDEIDELNPYELDKAYYGDRLDPPNEADEFMIRNKVNIAKAFLGKDGGYSLRKLKKFYMKDQIYNDQVKKELADKWKKKHQAEVSESEEIKEIAKEEDIKDELPKEGAVPEEAKESDESDIDEEWAQMDDEAFQKLVEEIRSMEFANEEEAQAFFDKKVKEEWNKMKIKKYKPQEDVREKVDPYYAMLKEDKPISSRYDNHFDLDDQDWGRFNEKQNASIGRYPLGFRQYENYENYRVVNSDADLQEYVQEMSKQCEFDEFKAIMKSSFLQQCDDPYFQFKMKIPQNPGNQQMTPELFVNSQGFDTEMKKQYQSKIQEYLMNRTWYKLVDALEDVTSFWNYGKDLTTMPSYNTYMPTRQHIMQKPDLNADNDNDVGFKYNMSRISPYHFHNPLKSYRNLPQPNLRETVDMHKPKFFKKYRRLSQHNKGFCTLNKPMEQANPIWYQTKFNSNLMNVFAPSYRLFNERK